MHRRIWGGRGGAITNSSGTLTSQQRYLPFGGTRAIPNSPILGTDFGYTGQRLLDSGMGGIMDYKARFYSPALGRFVQPDSIIPNPASPQAYNRFSYVLNQPINFNDPSGHEPGGDYCSMGYCDSDGNVIMAGDDDDIFFGGDDGDDPLQPLSGDDPVELSTEGAFGSGLQAQETFNRLASMCENYDSAAWWCSSPGTFTLRDFMMLAMSSELSPLGGALDNNFRPYSDDPEIQAKLTEAAANWFSASCINRENSNCIGTTPNAILNWLGENFESVQRLFPNTAIPTQHPNMNNLATAVVDAVLSVGSSPKQPGTWDLAHWANASWFMSEFGKVPSANYMILGGDNPAYVIPYGEERRLACGNPYC